MRFFIQTLGCKINQYESQSIREAWEAKGWREAASQSDAEVILVHTCAVTAGAVANSRGAVRRAGREAPEAARVFDISIQQNPANTEDSRWLLPLLYLLHRAARQRARPVKAVPGYRG